MKTGHAIDRYLARYPGVATLAYGVVLAVFLLIAWSALADLYGRYLDYAAAGELLDRSRAAGPRLPASMPARTPRRPARRSSRVRP